MRNLKNLGQYREICRLVNADQRSQSPRLYVGFQVHKLVQTGSENSLLYLIRQRLTSSRS